MTRYWRGEHDTSPRTRIVHALNVTILLDRNQNRTLRSTNLEVLRDGDFKLVVGKQEAASWFGAFAPVVNESLLPMLNELDRRRQALSYLEAHLSSAELRSRRSRLRRNSSRVSHAAFAWHTALRKASACGAAPCLFNIAEDPEERHDLSAAMPNKVTAPPLT